MAKFTDEERLERKIDRAYQGYLKQRTNEAKTGSLRKERSRREFGRMYGVLKSGGEFTIPGLRKMPSWYRNQPGKLFARLDRHYTKKQTKAFASNLLNKASDGDIVSLNAIIKILEIKGVKPKKSIDKSLETLFEAVEVIYDIGQTYDLNSPFDYGDVEILKGVLNTKKINIDLDTLSVFETIAKVNSKSDGRKITRLQALLPGLTAKYAVNMMDSIFETYGVTKAQLGTYIRTLNPDEKDELYKYLKKTLGMSSYELTWLYQSPGEE